LFGEGEGDGRVGEEITGINHANKSLLSRGGATH
jgi:hypothetical protein